MTSRDLSFPPKFSGDIHRRTDRQRNQHSFEIREFHQRALHTLILCWASSLNIRSLPSTSRHLQNVCFIMGPLERSVEQHWRRPFLGHESCDGIPVRAERRRNSPGSNIRARTMPEQERIQLIDKVTSRWRALFNRVDCKVGRF